MKNTVDIKILVNKSEISFNSYDTAIEYLQREQVLMNSDSFLRLIKENKFLNTYIKENGFQLPLGRVANTSYKGMTETYDYCFSDEYYEIAENLKSSESDIIDKLFYDNADTDGTSYECDEYYLVKVSEDFLSYKIITEVESR